MWCIGGELHYNSGERIPVSKYFGSSIPGSPAKAGFAFTGAGADTGVYLIRGGRGQFLRGQALNSSQSSPWLRPLRCGYGLALVLILLFSIACHRNPMRSNEAGYVTVPQAALRDRVAPIYNKVGSVRNGEKVEILERQKRFAKVRTASGEEGWIEQRFLIGAETFAQFGKLAKDNAAAPAQATGVTRNELNIHVAPARDAEKLYQLAEAEKVDILRRATTERAAPGANTAKGATLGDRSKGDARAGTPAKAAATTKAANAASKAQPEMVKTEVPPPAADAEPAEPKLMDDWWLVRDKQGHVGWVLARMIDVDVPLEIAEYAEGQRIQASFILNRVHDGGKDVPQYLVLLSPPKDGFPFDFNGFHVFSWNLRRHRYETAYRERNIIGFLPATTGTRTFDREGTQPIFTLRLQNQDGNVGERTYRLAGPLVKRVLAPGEEVQKLAQLQKERKHAGKTGHRHSR